jgi:serine/threonine protein phosphatase PrpC
MSSSVPDSEKVLVKGKTKSPTGWVNFTGENSPVSRVPVSSFKLPPINLEIKKSSLSESKSESILKNSVSFRPPSPKMRGSIVLETLNNKIEPFKARGSILIENKDQVIQKEKIKEKSRNVEEEKKEKNFNSKPTLVQVEQKVQNFVTRCACKTQTGSLMGKRKKHNQDSWIIQQKLQGIKGQFLFTVCDGHGDKGHKISALIRKNVVSCVEDSLNSTVNPDANLVEVFSAGIKEMVSFVENAEINMKFNGSTMVSVLVRAGMLVCANIGDSRAVIGRKSKNNTWKAFELSSDHKPSREDEARRVTLTGGIVRQYRMPNGTPVGPLRVWSEEKESPGLAMTRSIGDLSAKNYGLISTPELTIKKLSKKDKFLILATDGIWEFITSQESVEIVQEMWKKGSSEACCDRLIETATSRWERESVIDDITALVVFFK